MYMYIYTVVSLITVLLTAGNWRNVCTLACLRVYVCCGILALSALFLVQKTPENFTAQKLLAENVTMLVHGGNYIYV